VQIGDLGQVALYILFALVGVWLLTEALWQHGAPFRYRLLALLGFFGVVAGVVVKSPIPSGIGLFLFAVGQFLTTRNLRGGYQNGWVMGRKHSRGRRGRPRA
jgi:hypothetical protein